MEISYSTTKSEIISLYWKKWKLQLWKIHLIYFLLFFCLYFFVYKNSSISKWILVLESVLFGLLPLIFFITYPILKHKPQIRKFHIDEKGIKTSIGQKSASIYWDSIDTITKDENFIYIQRRNGNMFAIPHRAFENDNTKELFFKTLKDYLK